MKRELRKKMEQEIKDYQQQLWRDEDYIYYRELDAQRLKHWMHLAKYDAKLGDLSVPAK